MKKRVMALMLTCALACGMLAGCGKGAEEKGELNLYTWNGMFPQEILDGFEEETGYSINFSHFDYDEEMLAKLEETEGGDYDLVIADDYIIEVVIAQGLSQELDTAKLKNYGNLNPVFMSQFYDPDNKYTVPYAAGIPLIVYDPTLTDVEITGYEDLWNPALEDKMGEKLLELAPNVRVINDSNTQDFLLSGEVAAGFLYSSQVVAAYMANPELEMVYPKEGLGFGIMAAFIPSQAPNAEAAYAFLDYINEAENAAKCYEYVGYYSANKAAEEYISEEMKPFLVLPENAAAGEIIQNVSAEAEEKHSEIWNQFRNACE